jgi:hypothetical protein
MEDLVFASATKARPSFLRRIHPAKSQALGRSAKVFLVFFAIYLVTWGGHYTSGDGAHKIAWAKVLLGDSVTGIAPDSNGVYSKYGIGHSLIAMPSLALSSLVTRHTGVHCEAMFYTLTFIVNGALLIALIGFYLFQIYEPKRVLWTLALLGLATTWWPYTKTDFSEVLVATAWFGGFLLMRSGRAALGMGVAAITVSIRTDSFVLIAILALWWLIQDRRLATAARLVVAVLPAIGLVAIGNWMRYHSVLDHGYDGEAFTTPLWLGLSGILISGGKSIFLFSPPLLLGFLGWRRFRHRQETSMDALLFAAIFASQLLIYSRWWDWSSDDAWGVRFMIPSVMLMCIPLIEVSEGRFLVLAIGVTGLAIQLLAVTVGSLDYLIMMRAHEAKRQALFVSGENRVDFEDIRFNARYGQIAGNWILLRNLLHFPPQPSPSDPGNPTPLYDVLPPSVWMKTARWDFIWASPHNGAIRLKAQQAKP